MTKIDGVEEDLRYVRSVLDHADKAGSPAVIYYLWAVLSFVGMSLIDFKPEATGPFWALAGPLGGVASGYLGWKAGRRLGQSTRREGVLHTLHWTGMMFAIALLIPLQAAGGLSTAVLPKVILLIVAISYYTAGIYLDRRLFFIGMLTAGCYLATVFVRGWPWIWTFTGSILGLSLLTSGLLARGASRRTTAGGRP